MFTFDPWPADFFSLFLESKIGIEHNNTSERPEARVDSRGLTRLRTKQQLQTGDTRSIHGPLSHILSNKINVLQSISIFSPVFGGKITQLNG